MKKSNLFMAALLAVSMVFGFVGCSDDDDEKSSGSSGIVYKCTDDIGTETVTFNDDKTYVVHMTGSWNLNEEMEIDFTLNFDLDVETGTYTGDPSKDGEIKFKATKEANMSDEKMETLVTAAMEANKTSISVTNKEVPLTAVSSSTEETLTITGGKFTMDEDEFTKQ